MKTKVIYSLEHEDHHTFVREAGRLGISASALVRLLAKALREGKIRVETRVDQLTDELRRAL